MGSTSRGYLAATRRFLTAICRAFHVSHSTGLEACASQPANRNVGRLRRTSFAEVISRHTQLLRGREVRRQLPYAVHRRVDPLHSDLPVIVLEDG